MDIEEFPVNSWYAELEFDTETEMCGIWRARTAMHTAAFTHRLDAMYFNVDKTMPMRIHVTFDQSCDEFMFDESVPEITLCTEDVVTTTTVEPTTVKETTVAVETVKPETVGPWVAPTEPPVVLGEEECHPVPFEKLNGWTEGEISVNQFKVFIR